jgi:hypothetical protein
MNKTRKMSRVTWLAGEEYVHAWLGGAMTPKVYITEVGDNNTGTYVTSGIYWDLVNIYHSGGTYAGLTLAQCLNKMGMVIVHDLCYDCL